MGVEWLFSAPETNHPCGVKTPSQIASEGLVSIPLTRRIGEELHFLSGATSTIHFHNCDEDRNTIPAPKLLPSPVGTHAISEKLTAKVALCLVRPKL